MSELSITCPRCGLTSHNPSDVREGYCSNCHDWTRNKASTVLIQLTQVHAAYLGGEDVRIVAVYPDGCQTTFAQHAALTLAEIAADHDRLHLRGQ